MRVRFRLPAALLVLLTGCALEPERPAVDEPDQREQELASLRQEVDRAEREIAELRQELRRQRSRAQRLAEDRARLRAEREELRRTLADLETTLQPLQSRADAVSALADSRILVDRAEQAAPWASERLVQARVWLTEADRHIAAERHGSAMFFVLRGRAIADDVLARAGELRESEDTLYVQAERANVRARPSLEATIVAVLESGTPVEPLERGGGWVRILTPAEQPGWIHGSLVAGSPGTQ